MVMLLFGIKVVFEDVAVIVRLPTIVSASPILNEIGALAPLQEVD